MTGQLITGNNYFNIAEFEEIEEIFYFEDGKKKKIDAFKSIDYLGNTYKVFYVPNFGVSVYMKKKGDIAKKIEVLSKSVYKKIMLKAGYAISVDGSKIFNPFTQRIGVITLTDIVANNDTTTERLSNGRVVTTNEDFYKVYAVCFKGLNDEDIKAIIRYGFIFEGYEYEYIKADTETLEDYTTSNFIALSFFRNKNDAFQDFFTTFALSFQKELLGTNKIL